jgi:hypothetical protein
MLTSNVIVRRKFFYLEAGSSSFLLSVLLFYQNTWICPKDWAAGFTETLVDLQFYHNH